MTSLASLRARLKRLEQRAACGDDGPLARIPMSELFAIMYRDSDPEYADRVARCSRSSSPNVRPSWSSPGACSTRCTRTRARARRARGETVGIRKCCM